MNEIYARPTRFDPRRLSLERAYEGLMPSLIRPSARGFQELADHPDLMLYEVDLFSAEPTLEPHADRLLEVEQPVHLEDSRDGTAPPIDATLEAFSLPEFSTDLFQYPEHSWIGYDPDLANIPELGPEPDPVEEEDEDDEELRRLETRAAQLIAEMGSIAMSRVDDLHDQLLAVLHDFPHRASFDGIKRAILEGHTIEDIIDAAALKALWRDSSELWLARSFFRREGFSIFSNPSLRNELDWVSALRLVEDHGLVTAIAGLTSDWVEGWYSLEHPGRNAAPDVKKAYYTYLDYALGQVDAISMGDPDAWPYPSLFEHDPCADPLVRARVIPAAFHETGTGPSWKGDRPGTARTAEGAKPPKPMADVKDDNPDELTQQRRLEDILLTAAIRGHFG